MVLVDKQEGSGDGFFLSMVIYIYLFLKHTWYCYGGFRGHIWSAWDRVKGRLGLGGLGRWRGGEAATNVMTLLPRWEMVFRRWCSTDGGFPGSDALFLTQSAAQKVAC